MTTETVLTPDQILALFKSVPQEPPVNEGWVARQRIAYGRAIEQAVLQSPEIQALGVLLRESRQQLPLAAQFWNEDDEPERGSRNVKLVMELIARIDATMEKQP